MINTSDDIKFSILKALAHHLRHDLPPEQLSPALLEALEDAEQYIACVEFIERHEEIETERQQQESFDFAEFSHAPYLSIIPEVMQ